MTGFAAETLVEVMLRAAADQLDDLTDRSVPAWTPQPGPQSVMLAADVDDGFFGGARGGGKTDYLLGAWDKHQRRWGSAARGMLIRRTYPELEEVQRRAREIFVSHGATYRSGTRTWHFPNGATLKMRYLKRDDDADNYQGHSYTWIGIDEMGHFPSPVPIDKLRATLRSADGVRVEFRATANPGGKGHNWLKARYIDTAPAGQTFTASDGTTRLYVPARLEDNKILLEKDPNYWQRVEAAAGGQAWLLKAWRYGDWDITAGGMFDDLWDRAVHVVRPFAIPKSWRVDRSFDWGSSRPFSVGWWAESDGTPTDSGKVYPRGTLIRVWEWYGWTGKPNEGLRMAAADVGRRIVQVDQELSGRLGCGPVRPGPADPAIFSRDAGPSKADELAMGGAKFVPAANKAAAGQSKGARETGWERMRRMLLAAKERRTDEPGLYVFEWCTQFIRTVPSLARDERNNDDVDTEQEDHVADESRYRIMGARREATPVDFEI